MGSFNRNERMIEYLNKDYIIPSLSMDVLYTDTIKYWREFKRDKFTEDDVRFYAFRIDGVIYDDGSSAFRKAFRKQAMWRKLKGLRHDYD